MRKVTEQIVSAFRDGRKLTVSNSSTDGTTLFLHGNAIARKIDGQLEISFAGWPTRTTCERLRGLLVAYGRPFGVGITKGVAVFRYHDPFRERIVSPVQWHVVPGVSL
jgi:hypothetical protein